MLLVGGVEVEGQTLVPPAVVSEPRLAQPDSELFAQLLRLNDQNQTEVFWRSASLLDRTLPIQVGESGEYEFYQASDWQGIAINIMTLKVEWETELGTIPFVVQVAENRLIYQKRLYRYQRQVGIWLMVFGGVLLILLLAALGWALKPLERVRVQVGEIEQGARRRFDEDYPLEVNRLTQNLNQLLSHEESRIERQKEVLGNLAHSLKTPIAVLKGLPYSQDIKSDSEQQIQLMQTIIDYQLQSASAVGRRRFAKPITVFDPTHQIINSLLKLYKDKDVQVSFDCDPQTVFYGDHGDWMELVGNLCENAFKWCSAKVSISIQQLSPVAASSTRRGLLICVEDDGPGIEPEERERVLQRGVRLDSQTPGHGLGLSIVTGIVEAYDGSMEIFETERYETGTQFSVTLN